MSYAEIVNATEALAEPMQALSGFYEAARLSMDAAVQLSDDKTTLTIDEEALRAAISDIAPPDTTGQYELVTNGAEMGAAVRNDQLIVPWSALLDSDVLHTFDPTMWQALGFNTDPQRVRARGKPFAGLGPVPDAVRAPENMVRLSQMALSSSTLLSINQPPLFQVTSASAWLLNPNNMATLVIRPPAAPGDPGATNTDKQALKVEDFTDIVDCLKNAQYSWSWGWFVLSICIPKSCADRFVDLLSLGSGTLLGAGVALVTKGLTAAVASAGGYVALAIMLSALYWAAMIHFNETAKGVCLHIPMPWSFGVIGPGWAEGIK